MAKNENVVISGIDTGDSLPKGWTPYGVMGIIKCLDENGQMKMCLRMSQDWTMWEAVGALEAFAISLQNDLQDCIGSAEDDSEEPE